MSVWQPIETAPKDGSSILIGRFDDEGKEWRVASWDELNGKYPWYVEDAVKGFAHASGWPTHWMPLPEPPSGRIEPKNTMHGLNDLE